jgi:hypothetical protein
MLTREPEIDVVYGTCGVIDEKVVLLEPVDWD